MSISGKRISCEADGVNLDGTHEWDIQETGDRLEATTGTDRGRGRKDGGVIDTKASVKFYLSKVNGEFTRVRTGTILSDVRFFVDIDSATPIYEFDEAEVFDFQVVGSIRDRLICTCQLEAKGDVVSANDPEA